MRVLLSNGWYFMFWQGGSYPVLTRNKIEAWVYDDLNTAYETATTLGGTLEYL